MRPKNPLNEMETKAKQIKKIQFICNTILANACYHTKEMETQLKVAEKSGNMSDEERELICQAWDYRNKIAKDLIVELKSFMKNKEGEHEKTKREKPKN